jgi:cyclase
MNATPGAAERPIYGTAYRRIYAYTQPDDGWCLNNAGIVAGDKQVLLVDPTATTTRTPRCVTPSIR